MADLEYIQRKYEQLCNTKSDIYEHLPVLFKYASKCDSAIECGVRRCVSSWALLYGLVQGRAGDKRLLLNDCEVCDITDLLAHAPREKVTVSYEWCPDTELAVVGDYDMVFIDTWHVYGLLKRELDKFGGIIRKYIVMHDTTVDEVHSESVRNKHDLEKKMQDFGYTYEEVTVGLGRAIEEFLQAHPEWRLVEKLKNNNGLTVLERVA